MKKGREAVKRLKYVLLHDKMSVPGNFDALLRSDIYGLLNNYMEISEEGIALRVIVTDDGQYEIKIAARAERLKNIPIIL